MTPAQNEAAHLVKHVSVFMHFDVELEKILPKFVTLPEFYEGLKNRKMLFNRPWSVLYPILTKTKIAELMDIERLANTSILMFQPSKIAKFDQISEPNLFDLFEFDFDKFLELIDENDEKTLKNKDRLKKVVDKIKTKLLQLFNRDDSEQIS